MVSLDHSLSWETPEQQVLAIVNDAPHPSQCYVTLPYSDLAGKHYQLQDLVSFTVYERSGDSRSLKSLF